MKTGGAVGHFVDYHFGFSIKVVIYNISILYRKGIITQFQLHIVGNK